MKIEIEGTPKEIADLVLEIQSQLLKANIDFDKPIIINETFHNFSKRIMKEISTCELVKELSTREGVERASAEPYQDVKVSVNGPAIVLTIID